MSELTLMSEQMRRRVEIEFRTQSSKVQHLTDEVTDHRNSKMIFTIQKDFYFKNMQMLSDANKQIDEGFKNHSKLELRINDLQSQIQEMNETVDEQRRVILNLTNERDGFREETKELSKEKKEMFSRFMLQSGQWREKITQLSNTCKQQ